MKISAREKRFEKALTKIGAILILRGDEDHRVTQEVLQIIKKAFAGPRRLGLEPVSRRK